MKIRMMFATLVFAVFAMALCLSVRAGESEASKAERQAITKSVFSCEHCHVMALKAGDCPKCGMPMTEHNLLGVKDGQAMTCDCPAGCAKCNAATVKDGKCACGKDVKEVSAKGYYVCSEGCAEISDKPGKCACGKELHKVE